MYSIQFSHSVMSDSLRPHGPQHARPPCPSPTPGVYPNSWINSPTPVRWVGDAIQPSHPLSSPSPLPLNLSQHQGLLKWVSSSHQGGQSIGSSASTSVLPMNIQGWFPLGWTGWISLQSNSATPQFKSINFSVLSFLYGPTITSIHDYWKNRYLWLYGLWLAK